MHEDKNPVRLRTMIGRAAPILVAAALLFAGGAMIGRPSANAEEAAFIIPAPLVDAVAGKAETETALVAGGCFWGVQGVFQHVKGVKNAVSGYAGGSAETATYEIVSSGGSDHAEAVAITYDPSEITYGEILQVFFSVAHDPTQLNRQGPDRGTQYRSAIFATTPEQKTIAERYVAQLDETGIYRDKIVTEIGADVTFYPAEDYHQDFLTENPTYPYIVINDLPKIENLKKVFPEQFSEQPALVASARS